LSTPPTNDTSTCSGDSGGPLLAADSNNSLLEIGVTSVGPTDCDTDTADYFTSVHPIEPWIASEIRAVAPPPPIPTLTFADARYYVRETLNGVLGYISRQAHRYSASCSRDTRIRIGCSVKFWYGPNDYWGTVTISNGRFSGKIEWTDTYVIHWVNDYCYWHSGHRSTCRIHTRRGSW
jgi:hypothetical protein